MSLPCLFPTYPHLLAIPILVLEYYIRIAGVQFIIATGEVTLHETGPEVDEGEVDFLSGLRLDEPRTRDRADGTRRHANAREISRGLSDWLIIFIPWAVHVRSGH